MANVQVQPVRPMPTKLHGVLVVGAEPHKLKAGGTASAGQGHTWPSSAVCSCGPQLHRQAPAGVGRVFLSVYIQHGL